MKCSFFHALILVLFRAKFVSLLCFVFLFLFLVPVSVVGFVPLLNVLSCVRCLQSPFDLTTSSFLLCLAPIPGTRLHLRLCSVFHVPVHVHVVYSCYCPGAYSCFSFYILGPFSLTTFCVIGCVLVLTARFFSACLPLYRLRLLAVVHLQVGRTGAVVNFSQCASEASPWALAFVAFKVGKGEF